MSDDEKTTVRVLERSGSQPGGSLKPIVLKYKKSKKQEESVEEERDERKTKYSKGLGDIQRIEGNAIHIAQKATKALAKGVDVYERERGQSAREKTDGAIEDFIHNSAKASSAYLKEVADIPVDIAEAVSPTSYRKRLRKNLRRVSKFIGLWRI